ncbi:MAG: DegT/DnrJ/EryC1/StrS family aminotransferase [Candidatus Nanoarchaeia archaeon]|jgi:CDP-6-deoxy-D-xylo-4-hexulose-3-dehydrase
MKFLVTGSRGFIGSWLLKELPNAVGIDSRDCDIRDYDKLKEVIKREQPTHLIHLAAIVSPKILSEQPELAWEVNVKGTKNVLKICKELGIKAAIMSTALAYKETGRSLKENDALKEDGNVYIKSKVENERQAKEYGAVIIRTFDQEGPGRPEEYFTGMAIRSALNGKQLDLWQPNTTREFMDVRDGARGIRTICEKGIPGEVYNLSTGDGVKKEDYVKKVEEVLGKKIDYIIAKDESEEMLVGDNTKLKALGWTRQHSIEETIRDQAESKRIKLMKSTFYNETETKKELCNFIMGADKLSMGDKCREFEQAFAKWQGRTNAVMVNSGSSANLAILQALLNMKLIKRGDSVGFSALTWATNLMPIMQLGLNPVPIDVSLETLNVSLETLKQAPEMRLLFLTNLLGFCSDIDKIANYCKEKEIILIEDNCESLGSELGRKKLGNFGRASTFSFFVGHHMSTIEGGMICTDDNELKDMLTMVRAHGWTRDASQEKRTELMNKSSGFYEKYTFHYLGYNIRPTEMNAFIGLKQLSYLNEINDIRRKNYEQFNECAASNDDFLKLNMNHMNYISNFAYPIICKDKKTLIDYRKKFDDNRIEIRPIVGGSMVEQPFFKEHLTEKGISYNCPNAKKIHEQGFYFPNNPELTSEEKKLICSLIKK